MAQRNAADLAVYGLGQFGHKFHNARIFVGFHVGFDILLNFFFQLFAAGFQMMPDITCVQ